MPNGAIDHGQVHGLLDGFFDAHPLRMPYFGKSQATRLYCTVYHMLRYVKPTPSYSSLSSCTRVSKLNHIQISTTGSRSTDLSTRNSILSYVRRYPMC